MDEQRLSAIQDYFNAEFGGTARLHPTPSGSVEVSIDDEGDCSYAAHIAREFIEDHEPADIERLLREWKVAEEMRRLEGMEVSVSSVGVRLDSSN